MPAKISKEVRQRIYELSDKESKPFREILTILKSEGIKISDMSIYNIIKENKAKNQSFVSIEDDNTDAFNESFGDDIIAKEDEEEKKQTIVNLPMTPYPSLEEEIKKEENISADAHSLPLQDLQSSNERVRH